jgi:gluconate 5-dehydrogenase
MTRDFLEQVGPQVIARTPLARMGDEQDLKGIAVLLASDAASFITGAAFLIDGGQSCR